MNKTLKINFNALDISKAIGKLSSIEKNVNDLADNIARGVANEGLTQLDLNYANTPYHNNVDDITTNVSRTRLGYSINATGKDVLYEEFGTGDMGATHKHPQKSEYPLNDYNSGPTIRDANIHSAKHGITSGKYWTYKKGDTIYYTQGIPAGKQMFDTRLYLENTGIKIIKDKLVGDILSKL